jgi:hypothetical protein
LAEGEVEGVEDEGADEEAEGVEDEEADEEAGRKSGAEEWASGALAEAEAAA